MQVKTKSAQMGRNVIRNIINDQKNGVSAVVDLLGLPPFKRKFIFMQTLISVKLVSKSQSYSITVFCLVIVIR